MIQKLTSLNRKGAKCAANVFPSAFAIHDSLVHSLMLHTAVQHFGFACPQLDATHSPAPLDALGANLDALGVAAHVFAA